MLQEHFAGTDGLQRIWAFIGPDERARAWQEDKGIADPLLVDADGSMGWDWFIGHEDGAFANYPRHFVIDREGVLTYVGTTSSPEALRAAIEAALAE